MFDVIKKDSAHFRPGRFPCEVEIIKAPGDPHPVNYERGGRPRLLNNRINWLIG